MIICMQCGHQNEGKNLRNCENCGAILPRMDTSSMVRSEEQSGRVKQFSDAVENVRSGEWSPEEFIEFLQGIYEALSNLRGDIENLIVESEYEEHGSEEVEQGLGGMNLFEEGMEEMSLYAEDGDLMHLDMGMEKIIQGNAMINDAKRINRVSRQELEDEWGCM